ncbi:hypothetical protein FSS13T_19000 [Flavobacterium saliperosum S13]|uniref:Uncharacterized protein n=1 Tax=Flavobacterium saliperosum S13 TaxID=1341155 RepID=A0ABN0QFE6_9FLAO|nr:hypothetical protein FSS13T_19000 [Flavobacterium saliperosum S13]
MTLLNVIGSFVNTKGNKITLNKNIKTNQYKTVFQLISLNNLIIFSMFF